MPGPVRYLLLFLALLFLPSSTLAHNFIADPGVDHWTEVKILTDRIVITYSTYLQEGAVTADLQFMDLDKDGKTSREEEEMFKEAMLLNLRGFLSLSLNGQPIDLKGSIDFHSLRARRYRFTAYLSVLPPGEHYIAFYDGTFLALPGRLRTSLVVAEGVQALEWNIPEDHPLPENPKEKALFLLRGRKDDRTITVRYRMVGIEDLGGKGAGQKSGKETVIASTLGGGSFRERLRDMINNPRWDISALAATLLVAFALGAVHGLTPGHGKTIVAAYLVGTKGRVRDAILLGVIVTITHTFSVFVLGLGMLYASQHVMPQTLFPWLTALSGVLVAGMGIWLLIRRITSPLGHDHGHDHGHHHHIHPQVHEHPHDHGHGQTHSHEDAGHHTHGSGIFKMPPASGASEVSLGSLLSLGISGGLVPCPEALIVLLIAFALNRVALGLLILISFSVGLACVLVTIGVLLVIAKPLMARFTGEGKVFKYLPVASAGIITLLGLGIMIKGLMEAKIF